MVRLRRPPTMFPDVHGAANHLRFRISPDVTIALGVTVMDAAEKIVGQQVELLASHHPGADEMDAYERVLGDAMAGDATLFAREDYVEEAWRIVDPVLAAGTPVYQYDPGQWGPAEAQQRLRAAGRLGQSGRDQRLTRSEPRRAAMQIEILPDADAVATRAAQFIAAAGARGGRGARPLHVRGERRPHAVADAARARGARTCRGPSVHLFQVDERVAPRGDPDRNLTHIRESLLAHVALPAANVHAMPVEATDLAAAAAQLRAGARDVRRHAAGARSRASGPRPRRPHGVAGAGRSGARGRLRSTSR